MLTDATRLCHASEVAEDEALCVPAPAAAPTPGEPWFLVRHGGRLYGYRDDCPHIPGSPLAWRRHAYLSGDHQRIVCHAHGAQFEIATGHCVIGPCVGLSLTAIPLALAPDGSVHFDSNAPHPQHPPHPPHASSASNGPYSRITLTKDSRRQP
ncbi:Rieske 2Fe-2S domain-containing protein [Roseateles sp. SL47]|uniref:Rieske (2Fe-2S) protein n=1 Tax=Roseateles sp. SL47 TaxID=2995138 RepID=UPI002270AD4C|nr:Rieske 2Fe-2S domain-containing protein [Roseateles sp. SL47]WAC70831.1 Rieske 2Fe-2S domain-containing protein [Roseateles sp. SL47]